VLVKAHDESNALTHGDCTFQANLQIPTIGVDISTDLTHALVLLQYSVSDRACLILLQLLLIFTWHLVHIIVTVGTE
jgi:hypothetical protein